MFILSVRSNKKKKILALAVIALVVVAATAAVLHSRAEPQAKSANKTYSLSAATNDQRIAFFRQFGWEVDSEPVGVNDVKIPETFDDVYLAYNNIQQEQGLDLEPYRGLTCSQWIYNVTNFPEEESMRGTLLVYNGRVIGGDLSTPALDGFMTGFSGDELSSDYTVGAPTLAHADDGTLTEASVPEENTSSVEEALPPSSSEIPANAWPTD